MFLLVLRQGLWSLQILLKVMVRMMGGRLVQNSFSLFSAIPHQIKFFKIFLLFSILLFSSGFLVGITAGFETENDLLMVPMEPPTRNIQPLASAPSNMDDLKNASLSFQQEVGNSEYRDPITGEILSQILVHGGTVSKGNGASLVLPDFNDTTSVSFDFILGRNLTIQAIRLLQPGSVVVDPIIVKNNENGFQGYFLDLSEGQWVLLITTTSEKNVSFVVVLKIQYRAHSVSTAVELSNDTAVTEAFLISNERHFWKISLEKNQRGYLFITTKSFSLLGARLQVYLESKPFLPLFEIKEEDSLQTNSFNVSWVSETTSSYIIVLTAGSELKDKINPYQIVFRKDGKAYSFSTALPLEINSPMIIFQPFSQTIQQEYYFKFSVQGSRPSEGIQVVVSELGANVLENAFLMIYDEKDLETPILTITNEDQGSAQSGIMKARLNVKPDMTYYLVIKTVSLISGSFKIELQLQTGEAFLIEIIFFLLSVFISFIIIGHVFRISLMRLRPFMYKIPIGKDELISYFKKFDQFNHLLMNYSEDTGYGMISLPSDRFSFFKVKIWYSGLSQSEGTMLEFTPQWTRYRHVVIAATFVLILLVNQVLFGMGLGWSWVFLVFSGLANPLILLLLLLLTSLLIFSLIFLPQVFLLGWKRHVDEIMSIFVSLHEIIQMTSKKNLSSQDALNRVAYIRVLWSQAKKSLAEGQKPLFIIKADSCIKQLVYLRARQLGMNDFKNKEFDEIVEFLRENGFDVPSMAKIRRFHTLRNKIIHSTYVPTDEEIKRAQEYYQTFLSRLGLRI